MAPPPPSGSAATDRSARGAGAWRNPLFGRFGWDAPSPSPAEVAELTRLFPDVVQAPVEVLELESCVWGERALLARTFSRWVPPEAICRELHRAGIPGEVEVIALAHKHYIIRPSEILARDQILGRPWVINGQILAVTEWQAEFIPSANSLLHALVWIRLPLLPIEFWADEILSAILSVAGDFQYSDDSTKVGSEVGLPGPASELIWVFLSGRALVLEGLVSRFGSYSRLRTLMVSVLTVPLFTCPVRVRLRRLRLPLRPPRCLVLGWRPSGAAGHPRSLARLPL